MEKADSYKCAKDTVEIKYDFDIYSNVWPEANALRNNGILLKMAQRIKCPVSAFHGEYDLHSFNGVNTPLKTNLSDFRAYLLAKCGHKPWLELEAKNRFYDLLKYEINRK